MSKRATTKGNTPKEQSTKLHAISKKSSHTGNLGLTPSLYDDNVMVTQKVRKSQERNNPALARKK
jgi:predicted proteasome-type protease